MDARVIGKIHQFVRSGSFTVGEVRRRLLDWVRETFPEAFALGNLSFLPDSRKISAHMASYIMRSRYAAVDEVATDHLVNVV